MLCKTHACQRRNFERTSLKQFACVWRRVRGCHAMYSFARQHVFLNWYALHIACILFTLVRSRALQPFRYQADLVGLSLARSSKTLGLEKPIALVCSSTKPTATLRTRLSLLHCLSLCKRAVSLWIATSCGKKKSYRSSQTHR